MVALNYTLLNREDRPVLSGFLFKSPASSIGMEIDRKRIDPILIGIKIEKCKTYLDTKILRRIFLFKRLEKQNTTLHFSIHFLNYVRCFVEKGRQMESTGLLATKPFYLRLPG